MAQINLIEIDVSAELIEDLNYCIARSYLLDLRPMLNIGTVH